MRKLVTNLTLALIFVGASAPAVAKPSGMMPACKAGDPVVMMNMKTKTYRMMSDQDKTMIAHGNAMSGGMSAVCKSQATRMHARMMNSSAMSSRAMSSPSSGHEGLGVSGGTFGRSTAVPGAIPSPPRGP